MTTDPRDQDEGHDAAAADAESISPWDDPLVKSALKAGRDPSDIWLLDCPECDRASYYNQGSHFTCRFCDLGWHCITEDELGDDDANAPHRRCIVLGEEYTLADYGPVEEQLP